MQQQTRRNPVVYEEDDDDELENGSSTKSPRQTSEYFKRYELMTELYASAHTLLLSEISTFIDLVCFLCSINLRNPNHCPLGVYVMPSSDNLNGACASPIRDVSYTDQLFLKVWYGVIFVHKGYYRSGVFKFRMTIPESYPNHPPSVTFLTDMFHPLVDVQGNVSISQQFPTWRPYQDYLFHVLHYLKNMFKRVILDGLVDKHCLNKEAYRL